MEVGDQLLALDHHAALRHRARVEARLHGSDEGHVLGTDLVVEGHHVLDLLLRDTRAEEVVGDLDHAARAGRHPSLDGEVLGPRGDVDRRRRPEVVVLRLHDVAARIVGGLPVERRGAHGPQLARVRRPQEQPVRVRMHVDHLAEAGWATAQW